jgi:hypothetical protein
MEYLTPWEYRCCDGRFMIKTSLTMAMDIQRRELEIRSDREVQNVAPPVGVELADWQLMHEAMCKCCTSDVSVRAHYCQLAESKNSPLRQRIDGNINRRLSNATKSTPQVSDSTESTLTCC